MLNFQNHTLELANGVQMPIIGFGTWQIPLNEHFTSSVQTAIQIGYRHFDTAQIYNNAQLLGETIRDSGVPRSEFFISTKLWTSHRSYECAMEGFEQILEQLQMDYVDLLLIHWPASQGEAVVWQAQNYGAWRALETIYAQKRARAPGRGREPGIDLPERRNYKRADAVARILQRGVCRVLHVLYAARLEPGLYLPARYAEHGADYVPAPRRYAGEAARAAPAGEGEQHGLHIVVGVVSRDYQAAAQPLRRALEEAVAQLARGLLRAHAAAARVGGDVSPAGHALDAEPFAQRDDKALVALALAPAQAVVIVRRAGRKAAPCALLGAAVQQIHAVRPAGYRAQHPSAEQ